MMTWVAIVDTEGWKPGSEVRIETTPYSDLLLTSDFLLLTPSIQISDFADGLDDALDIGQRELL